jgi:acetyl esterase/lipase
MLSTEHIIKLNKALLALCSSCLLFLIGCTAVQSTQPSASEATSQEAPVTITLPAITYTPETTADVSEVDSSQREQLKRIYSDVPYVPDGEIKQRVDVFLPGEGEKPFPTILAIHGGGFRAGSRAYYIRIGERLNELGYAVIAMDYRLTPRFSYPSQVEDVFCALAWAHANHETYGLDIGRIAVMGSSAGGNLAAMLGTVDRPELYMEGCPHPLPESTGLRGAVVFYGPVDFTTTEGHSVLDVKQSLEPYIGGKFEETPPEKLSEMSPIEWVDGGEPPFLLIYGTLDTSVPSWMGEEFATTLKEAGVAAELVLVEDGHGFSINELTDPSMVQSMAAIEPFLSAIFEGD